MDRYQCLRCGAEYEWEFQLYALVPQYCKDCLDYLNDLNTDLEKILVYGEGSPLQAQLQSAWDYENFVVETLNAYIEKIKEGKDDGAEAVDTGSGEPDPGDEN